MREFHKWVLNNDQYIKDNIIKVVEASGIKVKFLGYYIEGNDHTYSMQAQPMYETLEEYEKDNPEFGVIVHARYFFRLTINNETRTLTAHINESDGSHFLFSIEELYETANITDVQKKKGFKIITNLISKKFYPYLEQIDKNQSNIDGYGKLNEDVLNKINYKLRLDWNYYSNRMEGGTLTRPETRQVMAGVSVGPRPLNDVKEMSGHDKAVQEILYISKGNLRISEKRIKDFHHLIMSEDDESKAALIGEWKKENNEVINHRNEKQTFLPYDEVPNKMHDLLNRTNAELDAYFSKRKDAKHPLYIATDFHIDYLYIHPFYDGNGRTVRLLTNLILISCGYPPIIITDITKAVYYRLISEVQSYNADRELLYAFLGNQMIESQKLILKAIKGDEISEEDDFDKEISLLKNELADVNKHVKFGFDELNVKEFTTVNYLPVLNEIVTKGEKLSDFFKSNQVGLRMGNTWITSSFTKAIQDFKNLLEDGDTINSHDFNIEVALINFTKNGVNSFNLYWKLNVEFGKVRYTVKFDFEGDSLKWEKLYHHNLTSDEQKEITDSFGQHMLSEIKKRVQNKQ